MNIAYRIKSNSNLLSWPPAATKFQNWRGPLFQRNLQWLLQLEAGKVASLDTAAWWTCYQCLVLKPACNVFLLIGLRKAQQEWGFKATDSDSLENPGISHHDCYTIAMQILCRPACHPLPNSLSRSIRPADAKIFVLSPILPDWWIWRKSCYNDEVFKFYLSFFPSPNTLVQHGSTASKSSFLVQMSWSPYKVLHSISASWASDQKWKGSSVHH